MDYVYSFDWYDGSRSGVADYNGQSYFFKSQWSNIDSDRDDWYKLSLISKEIFQLELERWGLWKRYRAAFQAKEVGEEHHPFLPVDRARGEELEGLLNNCLRINKNNYLIAEATFEPILKQTQQENNAEMVVYWKILSAAPCESRKHDYNP